MRYAQDMVCYVYCEILNEFEWNCSKSIELYFDGEVENLPKTTLGHLIFIILFEIIHKIMMKLNCFQIEYCLNKQKKPSPFRNIFFINNFVIHMFFIWTIYFTIHTSTCESLSWFLLIFFWNKLEINTCTYNYIFLY